MTARPFLPLALGLAATLAACGQNGSGSGTGASGNPDKGPPLPPATAAQAKAMVATLPAPFNAGDPELGKAVFARCQACHSTVKGGPDQVGPNLWGLFGRPAGGRAGYAYSDGLKNAGFNWDAEHLDKWLTDPKSYRPGTKMQFVGLRDDTERRAVIAYLKSATEAPPTPPL